MTAPGSSVYHIYARGMSRGGAVAVLEVVGLAGLSLQQLPEQLSGGQQRRLALAVQLLRNRLESTDWVHGRTARALARVVGRSWFTAACVLVRAQAYHQIGGFDEAFFMYFEDVDFCLRLEAAGWRLTQEPKAIAWHAGGVSGRKVVDDLYRRDKIILSGKIKKR